MLYMVRYHKLVIVVKLAYVYDGVSFTMEILFNTGSKFGNLGSTYPPTKSYPLSPTPPPRHLSMVRSLQAALSPMHI